MRGEACGVVVRGVGLVSCGLCMQVCALLCGADVCELRTCLQCWAYPLQRCRQLSSL